MQISTVSMDHCDLTNIKACCSLRCSSTGAVFYIIKAADTSLFLCAAISLIKAQYFKNHTQHQHQQSQSASHEEALHLEMMMALVGQRIQHGICCKNQRRKNINNKKKELQ